MMQIIKIINKKQLNKFISARKHSQFLQSWEWGEFQERVGNEVRRLGVEDDDGRLVAVATLIKKILPLGRNYFYCPHGPVGQTVDILFKEIEKLAKSEKVIFLRFEPLFKIQNSKFKIQKTIDIQPSKTLIFDLRKSEEELLKEMHQKTRYNIRLAKKREVKIVEAGIDRFNEFWRLMSETVERDGFRLHNREYYRKMIDIEFIKLYIAQYKNKIIAANVVAFFGDTVTYIHGASSNEHRNVMAPYLLQWYVIKLACEMGYKYYDFFGIDERKWPGVTRFKKGFGGKEIEYPGTFDFIIDKPWHVFYQLVRKIRRNL